MATIYRASKTEEAFIGSHWTDSRDEAVAYSTANGYGGSEVWEMDLEGSVLRVDDTVELAEAMMAGGFSMDHPQFDGEKLNAREIAREWHQEGMGLVWQVLEETDALDFIDGYGWIRFEEESITFCGTSTTYRRIS